MKAVCCAAFALLPLLATAQTVGAPRPEQIELLIVIAPEGSRRVRDERSVRYVMPVPTERACVLTVTNSRQGSGDVRADLAAEWSLHFSRDGGARPPATPPVKDMGHGWEVAFGMAKGGDMVVTLATYSGQGRTQSVLAVARGESCQPTVANFLEGISLAGAPKEVSAVAPVALPAEPTGGATSMGLDALVGFWHGVASVDDIHWDRNAGGRGADVLRTDKRVGAQYYLFLPDGSYTTDIPDFGIDAAALRAGSIYGRGKYSVSGDRVTLQSLAPGAKPQTVRVFNGVLQMPEGNLKRRPAVDGVTIEGSFAATDPADDRPTAPGRERIITFHADGRFNDQGAINVVRNARRGGRPLSFQRTGTGRYGIADRTLTLNYDDGQVTRLTVFYVERSAIGLAQVRLPRMP